MDSSFVRSTSLTATPRSIYPDPSNISGQATSVACAVGSGRVRGRRLLDLPCRIACHWELALLGARPGHIGPPLLAIRKSLLRPPVLPNACSTSGKIMVIPLVCRASSLALAIAMPGRVVGIYPKSPAGRAWIPNPTAGERRSDPSEVPMRPARSSRGNASPSSGRAGRPKPTGCVPDCGHRMRGTCEQRG